MLDQLFGLLLLGLGLQHPAYPAVKGDETENTSNKNGSGTSGEDESKNEDAEHEDGSTGSSGAETEQENSDQDKKRKSRPTQSVERKKLPGVRGATGALGVLKHLDTARLKEREEKLKEVFEARHEKIKEELEQRQKAASDQHAKERANFEKRLKNISDVQKRTVALRVDNKIPELNKRLTTNMTERLTNMQKVLERATLRLGEHKNANSTVDTGSVESEVATAQSLITSALGVVSTQSQKTYSAAGFSSEENLGSTMKTLVTQFETDIKASRATVNTAKSSIETVLKHVGELLGKGEHPDTGGTK